MVAAAAAANEACSTVLTTHAELQRSTTAISDFITNDRANQLASASPSGLVQRRLVSS